MTIFLIDSVQKKEAAGTDLGGFLFCRTLAAPRARAAE